MHALSPILVLILAMEREVLALDAESSVRSP